MAENETVERDWASFSESLPDGNEKLALAVEGIYCPACMTRIEKGLLDLEGVANARVNLTSHRLAVTWNPGETNPDMLLARLSDLGYGAHPFDPGRVKTEEKRENQRLLRALAVAGFAAMNVMLLSVSVWSGNASDITPETRDFFHWLSAFITLPAAAYAGQPFFSSAWRVLRKGHLNMDVPISIGVILALFLSVLQTVQHEEEAYFESALMLLFFLLIGRWLDHMMRLKTRAFAENLTALKAETAMKLFDDGNLREVPLSKIEPDDKVLVRPGECISVDGTVLKGASQIDQSLVTGETGLIEVSEGDSVYAGTLNGENALTITVTAAAKGTLLDEVNRLIDEAMEARSRHRKLADRAAELYAPIVHTASALTFLGWWLYGIGWQPALVISISVLIITCPCALGLAIPAVQVVASGSLFRNQVLLNSSDALERFANVDMVVFDKTGTLTRPRVGIVNRSDCDDESLTLAIALAKASSHPLSAALAAMNRKIKPITNATEEKGKGLFADHQGAEVRLGSPVFCRAEAQAEKVRAAHPTASLLAFAQEGHAPVVFALEQQLRSDASDVIARLKDRGIALMILSGDQPRAVEVIANELGIDAYHAGISPTDKIAMIEAQKAKGHKVMMVGDGMNDAPALAAADVSISPVTAAYVSQAASDALFLGEKLLPVLHALDIGKRARSIMEQNLWLATLYNVIAVPFAVAGFVTPLIAALAMSGSSLIVTINALRARAKGDAWLTDNVAFDEALNEQAPQAD
ncbi:heavy metal translocating P-type ATPase [Cohaesibacter celericrescens]|uniref:Copper-translocating P-type ATPase n=1 Tax=Cohaesibacter celericrescens TaxID=2067669 RepID=A0A2N5XKD8_9HYPH|nr:heavy metal translocating P-type ATPase [Cohaesibacter celericrescens]PLW74900.1 copper-translocating P-type ATPase [Cohaesibacter celericrescens]